MVRKVHGLGDIEAVNPENLILRFARSLEFGRDTNRIVTEATRIVQRMKRDWMVTGRRPAGICGAALIIAARMNNFRRTVREMVYVVKVTEITINKRLEEFKVTESSKFTIDEFRKVDLDSLKEHDPPSFYLVQEGGKPKGKRGRKRQAPETAAGIENGESEESEDPGQSPPPKQKRRIDKDGFAIPDMPIDPALRELAKDSIAPIDQALTSAVNDAITEMERDQSSNARQGSTSHNLDDDAASVASTDTTATGSTTFSETTGLPRKRRGRPKGAKNKRPMPVSGAELALEAAIEDEVRSGIDQIAKDKEAIQRPVQSSKPSKEQQPTPPTHNDGEPIPTQIQNREISMSTVIDEHEFEDDPEVANCLLSPAEREIKERIWVHENNTWLREQHRKRIQAQLKQTDPSLQSQAGQGSRTRKTRRPRLGDPKYLKKDNKEAGADHADADGDQTQNADPDNPDETGMNDSERAAGRAVKSMLENRAYSTRINYNVMQTLFPGMMARESSVESRRSMDEKARKRERLADQESRSQTSDSMAPSRAASPAVSTTSSSSTLDATRRAPHSPVAASAPSPSITKRSASTPPQQSSEENDADVEARGTLGQEQEDDESDVDVNIMGDMDDDDDEDEDVDDAFAGRYQRRSSYSDDDDED
ncbi:putative transcription factor tfiiib complex subunit brf1 [Phaeomoniella chlamydospora]|uniref:Putative transcription factor tfiiib complex subunit brf1 n=1 Tax=Phaeomoniella chlamydospora TaxID=158046 RepID=A0A0G2EJ70_PHACM|nr:putative transcription factor tfiiib complex subunit brf1 [Phaeomoniella chlamydospora]